jgi:hypothetical protein
VRKIRSNAKFAIPLVVVYWALAGCVTLTTSDISRHNVLPGDKVSHCVVIAKHSDLVGYYANDPSNIASENTAVGHRLGVPGNLPVDGYPEAKKFGESLSNAFRERGIDSKMLVEEKEYEADSNPEIDTIIHVVHIAFNENDGFIFSINIQRTAGFRTAIGATVVIKGANGVISWNEPARQFLAKIITADGYLK